jgi:hypothetical protein
MNDTPLTPLQGGNKCMIQIENSKLKNFSSLPRTLRVKKLNCAIVSQYLKKPAAVDAGICLSPKWICVRGWRVPAAR